MVAAHHHLSDKQLSLKSKQKLSISINKLLRKKEKKNKKEKKKKAPMTSETLEMGCLCFHPSILIYCCQKFEMLPFCQNILNVI